MLQQYVLPSVVLLSATFIQPISASFFTSSPDVVWADPGTSVQLTWTYNGTYRPMEWYSQKVLLLDENGLDRYVGKNILKKQMDPDSISFILYDMSVDDFGRYRCEVATSRGNFSDDNAQVAQTGAPKPPYDFTSSRVTAASILVEWRAGSNGSSGQIFRLEFSQGYQKGKVFVVDNDVSSGQLMSHKIGTVFQIKPGQSYRIQLAAYNHIGTTYASAINVATKERPGFQDKANVTVSGDKASITWSLHNPESVSHIFVVACDQTHITGCVTTNITNPLKQPYRVSIPDQQHILFTFTFYDGEDVVSSDYLVFSNVENPLDLICTHTTAVSLYLQWRVGFSGGYRQLYNLTYIDTDTYSVHSEIIDGHGTQTGQLTQYKLNENIFPEHTYRIRVHAYHEKRDVHGPSITMSTKARPGFQGEPQKTLLDKGLVLITWSLTNPGSVTHIYVTSCDATKCLDTNVTQPDIQPYRIQIPGTKKLSVTFYFYDREDIVNEVNYEGLSENEVVPVDPSFSILMSLMLIVGVLFFIAAVVLVLCSRKRCKREPQIDPLSPMGAVMSQESTHQGKVALSDKENVYIVDTDKSSLA